MSRLRKYSWVSLERGAAAEYIPMRTLRQNIECISYGEMMTHFPNPSPSFTFEKAIFSANM